MGRMKYWSWRCRSAKATKIGWVNLTDHSGEFNRDALGETIRVSVHSLNTMSVTYHESLHAFTDFLRSVIVLGATAFHPTCRTESGLRLSLHPEKALELVGPAFGAGGMFAAAGLN
jgi:hypothetical protein